MKPAQPNRTARPAIPRQGAEVVFKRLTPLRGYTICTVSYLQAAKPVDLPVKKRGFFSQFAGLLSRFRRVFPAKPDRFGGK
jgi:hypothetical protein